MPRSRNADRAQIRSMSQEGRLEIGEAVLVKIISGSTIKDPAQGIGRVYSFRIQPTRAIIESISQTDIMNSGGLYLVGDLSVQLNEKLREVVDRVGNIGDRLIWNGKEYRVVGIRRPETLTGKSFFYSYAMRKVEDLT